MTVLGTRPEIIRLSLIIKKFDETFDHVIVHTGQNFDPELNDIFFEELSLPSPTHSLVTAGGNAFEQIGRMYMQLPKIIEAESPDAFFVLGDTNSCLSAYVAKRFAIPVFHFEAGNRCFDSRVPEEINRKLVDHLADVNLCYSSLSRDHLIAEGFPRERIFAVGSPLYEVINQYRDQVASSDVLSRLSLDIGKFFVLSVHRQENVDSEDRLLTLISALQKLETVYDLPIVMTAHPRTRARLAEMNVRLPERLKIMKPFSFFDYLKLQMSAKAVLSDSGTINEEASILRFPALNLRDTHERPEGMVNGVVPLVGIDHQNILSGLDLVLNRDSFPEPVADYQVPDVASRVTNIVLSYCAYVNRVVWFK